MKTRTLTTPFVLLSGLLFAMFVISCGKDGATGPTGETGPAGPAGPAGDSGSATVIYSEWLNVAFLPDTIHNTQGQIDTIGFYASIDVPRLTVDLLNTADVKVYINSGNATDPTIYILPYSDRNGLYISVSTYTQRIGLYSNANLSTGSSASGSRYQQYRYMIIPGNTSARSTQVNWSDYTAAKTYLGLKD